MGHPQSNSPLIPPTGGLCSIATQVGTDGSYEKKLAIAGNANPRTRTPRPLEGTQATKRLQVVLVAGTVRTRSKEEQLVRHQTDVQIGSSVTLLNAKKTWVPFLHWRVLGRQNPPF